VAADSAIPVGCPAGLRHTPDDPAPARQTAASRRLRVRQRARPCRPSPGRIPSHPRRRPAHGALPLGSPAGPHDV